MVIFNVIIFITMIVNSLLCLCFCSVDINTVFHNQPLRCVFRKRRSENIQQIYNWNRTSSAWVVLLTIPVSLIHIFRTPFPKNTSAGLLLFQSRSFAIVWNTHFIIFSFATRFISRRSFLKATCHPFPRIS